MTYVIRQTRNFYGPSKTRTLVDRGDGYALEFDTRAAAREWIAAADSGIYYESHNEYGRPEYKILRADRLPAYLAEQL